MTFVFAAASLLLYILGAALGWRLGYTWGYEAKVKRGVGYSYQSPEDVAVERGVFAAILWPLLVPALLIGRFATPTPPSLAKKIQDDNARRIAELERELGIGVRR